MKRASLTLVTVVSVSPCPAQDAGAVPYPRGYRDQYHIEGMVIDAAHPLYAAFGHTQQRDRDCAFGTLRD
jgi:hypothetical protein